MPVYIAQTLADVRNVKPFTEGQTWEHARQFLAAAPTDPFADHLRWLEEDGRPVACVQIFLHQYPIGCARIGMCLPEYPFVPPELRGRGYFKHLMADLFAWMRGAGYPLAYDHGRKGLYTGLGYAPCFHHGLVLIRVADALKVQTSSRAEAATEADVAAHEDLFREPFPLGRGLQCRDERWRPDPAGVRLVCSQARNGMECRLRNGTSLRCVPDYKRQEISGFVVLHFADFWPRGSVGEVVTITDSWAADVLAAAVLLRTAAEEARDRGFTWIRLNGRRGDPLTRVAVLAGGELRWSAAQERDHTPEGEDVDAFYLADLRLALEQLQPELNARWKKFPGDAPPVVRIGMEDEEVALGLNREVTVLDQVAGEAPCLRLPRKAMTQAIMGYATPTELSLLHEGCDVPAACRAVADALFAAREPHLIHEELAFAQPPGWGLVP